jgi:23S rRNA (cytidine1920-2'-O)/16S rRNA (cytidine1409-2'-O)-methyltransferase
MHAAARQRLDLLLTERGLAGSREQAQRLIRAGSVRVAGQVADKPGHLFAADAEIAVAERERFVSRGGEKLEAAFREFALAVEGRVAVDVGASTGGFTDCLLQHGAARVYAIDVGHGQLAWRLRSDPRVVVMDGVNARYLKPEALPEPADLAVVDVAFISLTLVLPAVAALVRPGGGMVTLIKPQFEAGRAQVGRGGVVRDPAVHDQVVARVRAFGAAELKLAWEGCCRSPILGPAGNVEFLAYWRKPLE